jgi:lysophospholipase L1-like esterase
MQSRWIVFLYVFMSTLVLGQHSWSSELRPRHLFIAGDSTAASYQQPDHQGWGAVLQDYFDGDQIKVDNRGRGGRSSRTFITEGLWQSLIDDVQPGDLVFIQFGHNDAGKINDDRRARGSLPGIGTDKTEIFNLLTQQDETVYTFGHYIRQMVADVRAKQATPVLLSLTVRNEWQNDHIERGSGQYGQWMYQLAWELDTPFIDVTNLVADELESLGEANVGELYPKDHTHFNASGAELHARTIVAAIKGMRPGLDPQVYSKIGRAVNAYDWTFVRLPFVADPKLPGIFLVGDSTVRNGRGDGADGQWGWGDFLGEHIDTTRFNIVNRAVGGFSSRTFITGGHWKKALNMMRPGDYVVIQFGHNDSGALNDDSRARGTIDGTSEAEQTINNLLTGKSETVHSYGWYLREMVGEALARGVTPIICSPVPRMIWDDSGKRIQRPVDSYPQWAQGVAKDSGSSFIDLHSLVADRYDELGPERVKPFFADKHTHTSREGARFTAELVAAELRPLLETEHENIQ